MSGGRVVAAALVLSLAAGCSAKDKTAGAPSTTTSTVDAAKANASAPVDASGKQPVVRPGDRYSASSPPMTSMRPPDGVAQPGSVPLAASIAPGCVEHGQTLKVVLKSDPRMTVVAQIKWPNEQFSGLDNTRGTTGADGTLSWEVSVKPSALYGQATLQAAAIDENSSRSGTSGAWDFVVAPPGRC
jgi:hypothetical protein